MTTETKETQKTEVSAMEVIAKLLEQNNQLLKEVIELRTNGGGSGTTRTGRAPKRAVRCMDTKTGNVYHSHASAGMAVAPEYGLKVHNFVWYEVIAKDKTRFTDISEEEYQAVLKANAEKQAPVKVEAEKQPTQEELKALAEKQSRPNPLPNLNQGKRK